MKRVQLFEFEDQSWFPDKMRIALTRLIIVLHKMMGLGEVLSDRIQYALNRSGKTRIVDLGSGAGGAMPMVHKTLDPKVVMILTDLYPNKKTVASFNKNIESGLSYYPTSVDATLLQDAPKGLKTMINCFHHMDQEHARGILSSVAKNKDSILIYEMAENKIPLLIWWLLLPISLVIMIIMVLFMTPFVKPLTFHQVFFTYIIPIIPISYAWDGQASMPRIYTIDDIHELLKDVDSTDFEWEVAPAKNKKGKNQGYYVFGTPKNS